MWAARSPSPQMRNTPRRSRICHGPLTSASTAVAAPIRMPVLPRWALLFFIVCCHPFFFFSTECGGTLFLLQVSVFLPSYTKRTVPAFQVILKTGAVPVKWGCTAAPESPCYAVPLGTTYWQSVTASGQPVKSFFLLLSANGGVIYKKVPADAAAQKGRLILLALEYKLNSVCNAERVPRYRRYPCNP